MPLGGINYGFKVIYLRTSPLAPNQHAKQLEGTTINQGLCLRETSKLFWRVTKERFKIYIVLFGVGQKRF